MEIIIVVIIWILVAVAKSAKGKDKKSKDPRFTATKSGSARSAAPLREAFSPKSSVKSPVASAPARTGSSKTVSFTPKEPKSLERQFVAPAYEGSSRTGRDERQAQLNQLERFLEAGLIDKEEYRMRKQKILGS